MSGDKLEGFMVRNEHMDPDQFYDQLLADIGDCATLDFPNFEGAIYVEFLTKEYERVRAAIENAAGEIFGEK